MAVTKELTIAPEILASLPMTKVKSFYFEFLLKPSSKKAAVNFTTSTGVRLSSTFTTIVPRIPEILLIKDILIFKENLYILKSTKPY